VSRPAPLLLRRALAAVAVAGALVVGGAAASGAAPATVGSGQQAPETEPATSSSVPGPTDGGAAPTEADAQDDAQAQADADLRRVWEVVVALGVVAVGLLVLLVLYVRATNPTRAALRRKTRIVRAEHRLESKQKKARAAAGEAEPGEDDDVVAREEDADEDEPEDDEEDGEDGEDEVPAPEVTVAVAAPPAPPVPDAPARATRPVVAPGPARRPAPKRPRRVQAPAKKLATPDAERVLVRPGQAPIRVPSPPAPEGGEPEASDDDARPRTDGRPPPAPRSPGAATGR
jgi:hypothetical protein